MLNERHPRNVVICLPDMRTSITSCIAITLLIGAIGLTQSQKSAKKQFLNVDGKKPPGYTHVVTSASGKMIFISGRGGAAKDGKLPADFATQATNTFEDLKRCLAMAGRDLQRRGEDQLLRERSIEYRGVTQNTRQLSEHGCAAGGDARPGRLRGRHAPGDRSCRDPSRITTSAASRSSDRLPAR